MKTHEKKDISSQFTQILNLCCVHSVKPSVFRWVVGKRKEVIYTVTCPKNDDCGKIAYTPEESINAWNKWNPVTENN